MFEVSRCLAPALTLFALSAVSSAHALPVPAYCTVNEGSGMLTTVEVVINGKYESEQICASNTDLSQACFSGALQGKRDRLNSGIDGDTCTFTYTCCYSSSATSTFAW